MIGLPAAIMELLIVIVFAAASTCLHNSADALPPFIALLLLLCGDVALLHDNHGDCDHGIAFAGLTAGEDPVADLDVRDGNRRRGFQIRLSRNRRAQFGRRRRRSRSDRLRCRW